MHGSDSHVDENRVGQLYEDALKLTREQKYDEAALSYEKLLCSFPGFAKGWISFGQMQKKRFGGRGNREAYDSAKLVLERGSEAVEAADSRAAAAEVVQVGGTPVIWATSIHILITLSRQALGLLHLQYGRQDQAITLLERAVEMDERLKPVLNWKSVREAREASEASGRIHRDENVSHHPNKRRRHCSIS